MSKRRHYQPITDQANRPNTRPNYRKILEAAHKDGTLAPIPGAVNVVEIQHDPNCAIYRGEPCSCDPDIIQQPPYDRTAVLPERNKP